MSRRSIAHSVRTVQEVSNSNNTRRWTIAVYTPQTREDREAAGFISARRDRWLKKDAKRRAAALKSQY